MLLPMNRVYDELNKVDNYRKGKKESTSSKDNENEVESVSDYLESILEHIIENKKNINENLNQSPSRSYFDYSTDFIYSELYFKYMSAEDKIQFKKLLSTEVTTDISVQTMENSMGELKRIYGKENVQNLLKKD